MKSIPLWAVLEQDGYNAADVVAIWANETDAIVHASRVRGYVQQVPEVNFNKRPILGDK